MATTPLQGLPYPASTAVADVPADVQALAVAAEPLLVQRYTSAAARTAAYAAAALTPANWAVSVRLDATAPNLVEYYNAGAAAWRVLGPWRQTSVLGSSAASIVISGIPTYLRRLDISWTGRCDAAATNVSSLMRINADSGANYRYQYQTCFGTSSSIAALTAQTAAGVGNMTGASSTAGVFAGGNVTFHGWDVPHASHLVSTAQGGFLDNTAGNSSHYTAVCGYTGSSASGYTSVTLLPGSGSLIAGSSLTVVGVE